jgi:hypothetical protein
MSKHSECKEGGSAINGVMNTLSSVVLVVQLILNVSNANNNNNNNNNNDNNDNNNNNIRVGTLVAESEFDNEYGTMSTGMGKRKRKSFMDFDDYSEANYDLLHEEEKDAKVRN